MSLRNVPWVLAALGLVIPLLGTGFATWPVAVGGAAALVVAWAISRRVSLTRGERIAAALVLLPILVALAFEGGWWMIPADLAWLTTELTGTRRRRRAKQATSRPARRTRVPD